MSGVRGRSPPRQAFRVPQKAVVASATKSVTLATASCPVSSWRRDAESPTMLAGSGREVHEKPLVSERALCEDRLAASAHVQRKAHNAYVAASARLEKSDACVEAAQITLDSLAEQERRCRGQGTSIVGSSMRKNWEVKIQSLEERRETAEEALAAAVAEAERDRRDERSAQELVRKSILESRATFYTLEQLRSTEKNGALSTVCLPSRWRAPIAGTPSGEPEHTGSRKIRSPRSSPGRGQRGASPAKETSTQRRFTRVDCGNRGNVSEVATLQTSRLSAGSSEVSLASTRASCSSDASAASLSSSTLTSCRSASGVLALTSARKHDGRSAAVAAAAPAPLQRSAGVAAATAQRRWSAPMGAYPPCPQADCIAVAPVDACVAATVLAAVTVPPPASATPACSSRASAAAAELAALTAGGALPSLLVSPPSLPKSCTLPANDQPLGSGKDMMADLSKMSPEDLRKCLMQLSLDHLEMVAPAV